MNHVWNHLFNSFFSISAYYAIYDSFRFYHVGCSTTFQYVGINLTSIITISLYTSTHPLAAQLNCRCGVWNSNASSSVWQASCAMLGICVAWSAKNSSSSRLQFTLPNISSMRTIQQTVLQKTFWDSNAYLLQSIHSHPYSNYICNGWSSSTYWQSSNLSPYKQWCCTLVPLVKLYCYIRLSTTWV